MKQQQFDPNESYEAFRERVFGPAYMVWHEGGPDVEQIRAIKDPQERLHTAKMLTRGIVEEKDVDAIPAWAVFDAQKGVEVIKPLVAHGEKGGFIAALAQFLFQYDLEATEKEKTLYHDLIIGMVTEDRGIHALDTIIAARKLPIDQEIVDALLDRVAHAPGYLTRYHAANSLLELGNIEPRGIADHKDIFSLIVPRLDVKQHELKPNDADWKRHKQAADLLKALIQV